MRVAWHSSGTFDKSDGSGGANGATMRFEPEASDGANAGLHIVHDLLHPVKSKFPTVSFSDIWAAAGCVAVESLGGPEVPFNLGSLSACSAPRPACPTRRRGRSTSATCSTAWASTTATSWR